MAAIVQQSTGVSAARAFWNAKMQDHPNVAGGLAIAGSVAGFFLNGHALIRFGQWVVRVTGSIAESVLLFAVLWISGTSVAPSLIELVMSEKTMQYFVSVALLALALIPEIILGNAIVNALGHVQTATQQRTPVAWAWAGLFVLPTVLFLWLTAYTLNTLVANGGNFVQASAGLVGLRCFAGWTYGLLAVVYAGIGRRTLNQPVALAVTPAQPVPAQPIDYQEIASLLLPLVSTPLQELRGEVTGQIAQLSEHVAHLQTTQNAPISEQRSEQVEDTGVNTDQTPIVNIAEYRSGQDSEQVEDIEGDGEMYTLPSPKVTQKLDTRKSTQVSTQKTSDKARKAASLIKRNPTIGPSELAKKAQISRSYASQILKQLSVNE